MNRFINRDEHKPTRAHAHTLHINTLCGFNGDPTTHCYTHILSRWQTHRVAKCKYISFRHSTQKSWIVNGIKSVKLLNIFDYHRTNAKF